MNDSFSSRGDALGRFRGYLRVLAEAHLTPRLHSKVDPSDIVQATLLKAYEGLADLRGKSDAEVAAWLRKILARNLLNTLREYHREKRDIRRERSLEAALSESSVRLERLLHGDSDSPAEELEDEETLMQLAAALARLPDAQREALVLQHWEGWSLDQIGQHMGRTRHAVAGLLRRGIQRLREDLRNVK